MRNIPGAIAAITIGAMSLGTAAAADRRPIDHEAHSQYRSATRSAESTYRITSEQCRKYPAGERSPCLERAKAVLQRERTQARARLRWASARAESKRKADYRDAWYRCDSLRGREREACLVELDTKPNRK